MGVVRRGRFRGKTGVVGVGVPTLPHTGRSPHAGRSLCIMWGSWGGGGGHCGGVRGRGRRISPTTAIGLWTEVWSVGVLLHLPVSASDLRAASQWGGRYIPTISDGF